METASTSDLKPVMNIQKIGKNMTIAMPQPRAAMAIFLAIEGRMSQTSRLRANERTRKKATMLARMIAITPPAEPPPTSNCSSARA